MSESEAQAPAASKAELERLNSELQQRKEENSQLTQEVASLRSECKALKQLAGAAHAAHPGPSVAIDNQSPLLWKGCARLPSGFVRPHVVVKGTSVFVGGGNGSTLEASRTVFKYSSEQDTWLSLPFAPQYTFALVTVHDVVTVVGGVSVISSALTNAIMSFDENTKKWGQKFPAMPTERCASSALATDTHLIVIGGLAGRRQSYSSVVEVLDLSTLAWSTAAPTLAPVTFMSIALCPVRRRIYLTGGLTEEGAVRAVFGCRIDRLLHSVRDSNAAEDQVDNDNISAVWEIVTDAPYVRSGCVAVNGKLVTASGLDGEHLTTTRLHVFSPEANSWQSLGVMPAARSSCSLAVLDAGRLMVVGGYIDPRNWTRSLTTDVMECVNLQV